MTNKPSQLIERLTILKDIDFRTLERAELGQEFNFKNASIKLEKIYKDLVEAVSNFEILELPNDHIEQIKSIGNNINDYIEKIKAFSMSTGSIEEIRNIHGSINTQIDNIYQNDLKYLRPAIREASLIKIKPEEVERQISQATTSSQEIEKIKQDIKNEANNAKKEVEKTIKDIQDAIGSGATGISSSAFEKQAGIHETLSKWWFWASFTILILSFTTIFILFKTNWITPTIDSNITIYELIHISIFKIVLLSLVYLLVYQSIKNYKINKHLHVLNRHRQLSLTVYPIMIKASSDPAHSSIIAGQAAKSIFEPNTTGYLDGDDNINPINLTEIINKVVEHK